MKDFKFKFSRTAVILSVLAIALALGGAGWTIYRIIRFGFPSFTLGLRTWSCSSYARFSGGIRRLLIRSFYRITDKETCSVSVIRAPSNR
ncbi:MAG: hypothetical protein ACLRTQ_01505 [Candidatus Borkfalkia sp.]